MPAPTVRHETWEKGENGAGAANIRRKSKSSSHLRIADSIETPTVRPVADSSSLPKSPVFSLLFAPSDPSGRPPDRPPAASRARPDAAIDWARSTDPFCPPLSVRTRPPRQPDPAPGTRHPVDGPDSRRPALGDSRSETVGRWSTNVSRRPASGRTARSARRFPRQGRKPNPSPARPEAQAHRSRLTADRPAARL